MMSPRDKTALTGPRAGDGAPPSAPDPIPGAGAAVGRDRRPPDAAGRAARAADRAAGRLAMAWLLAGLPLLLAGRFTPVLMLVVSVPLAALLVYLGLRWIPGRWQSALPPGPRQARTPWWAVVAVIAVAVAFGVDQLIYHSQQIIVERDPASYIQFAYWIAHHGSLPIPQARAAFGGTHQLLALRQPRLLPGRPERRAAVHGGPADGPGGRVLGRRGGRGGPVPPLLGACAVLAFGGLVARLVGPRWAPLAALVLALSLPEQFTSRSTYSEPLAQILFLGGLCLVIDSLAAEGSGGPGAGGARRPGARPDPAGAHRRSQRHPAGDPVLRDPAPVPAAAGGPAARRPGGRRALRRRRRPGPVPAVPGDDQQLADAAGRRPSRRSRP